MVKRAARPDDSENEVASPEKEENALPEEFSDLDAASEDEAVTSDEDAVTDEEGFVDPGSDSSEDDTPNTNTIGSVPLHWYKEEDHIGYDVEGAKIIRAPKQDKLDKLLARNDDKNALRTIYDEYNDKEIVLSKEELKMLMNIRKGRFPDVNIDPFQPYDDFFTRDKEIMPILDHPEPKSRFVESKWEAKKVLKLVQAIRKGWLKTSAQKAEERARQAAENESAYLLWADDGMADASKTESGLTYIPAPKPLLPGHALSYNPPKEYLPTEEELAAWALAEPEDRPKMIPQRFSSLRVVPAYADFVKEQFNRCLDLYLCPRVRRKRFDVKPEQLVPQLPKPKDLQPFPNALALAFRGHHGKVNSVSPDPFSGTWLLSGGQDGTVRLWEVRTGRCMEVWQLGAEFASLNYAPLNSKRPYPAPVRCVAWCPALAKKGLAAAAVGSNVVLFCVGRVLGGGASKAAAAAMEVLGRECLSLSVSKEGGKTAAAASSDLAMWSERTLAPLDLVDNKKEGGEEEEGSKSKSNDDSDKNKSNSDKSNSNNNSMAMSANRQLLLQCNYPVFNVVWHAKGDYFATVSPDGHTRAVLVHQLSQRATQNPFRKNRGRVIRVCFHPTKPIFFVASQQHVRVYDLAKQSLVKKLLGSSGCITSIAVHPSGDHVIVGSDDRRLAWYDMDLSTKPYRALRYHEAAVQGVAFHRSYPLFASCSNDGTVNVFHGTVYNDLLTNPLIVPVKILRGHVVTEHLGVMDVAFHPTQPWIFTAGADSVIGLYCNL
mmetsp:Transcript_26248/g.48096  ORF Transcript_26248/g.48096 Transcript_26248/m.48096 type:complete len:771 (-) Transcript_26248:231-2543(-)|eukprot:CAMPEP_0175047666 /NCGR_PEP_ID=MMETSP0052_2-20121109/5733_1 /TAXON_ID=51329 ORGANISM="Polytomella parva, Strain SAG 63-3" /NCGR_SAMPLE_ID=MMETSP0052_2 /ASSEMBLY_ACC=CAM_ASM_000194 /LENGTH=770 /DNA_ID=CAMNT_0016311589 /DNA_START=17 /DNA_END=2329 /DNA_ORIENTATION=+